MNNISVVQADADQRWNSQPPNQITSPSTLMFLTAKVQEVMDTWQESEMEHNDKINNHLNKKWRRLEELEVFICSYFQFSYLPGMDTEILGHLVLIDYHLDTTNYLLYLSWGFHGRSSHHQIVSPHCMNQWGVRVMGR